MERIQQKYNYHTVMAMLYEVQLEERRNPTAARHYLQETTLIGKMWKNRLHLELYRIPLDSDDRSTKSVDSLEAGFIKTLAENCDEILDPNSRFCQEMKILLDRQPAGEEEEVQSRLRIPIIDLTNDEGGETSKADKGGASREISEKGKGKQKM